MAKLLLDANLSWRSIKSLQEHFEACYHADSIGLKVPAKDIEIWDYAKGNNLIIITNDEDFFNLLMIKGFPPKIILLKTGNQNRKKVEEVLICAKEQIEQLLLSSELGLLEIVD